MQRTHTHRQHLSSSVLNNYIGRLCALLSLSLLPLAASLSASLAPSECLCWLKILVQKCRRRHCTDMLLLITLIALACLCDSHSRNRVQLSWACCCIRCVCVMHAYLCRTDVCASLVTALAFQFQFCNFGSCQVALSLQLSVQLTRCLLLPATCLLPSTSSVPKGWGSQTQTIGRQFTSLFIAADAAAAVAADAAAPHQFTWPTDLRSCRRSICPAVSSTPTACPTLQLLSACRSVCVCVEHVKCMSPVKLLESLCISLPLSPLYLSCIAAVGPTFVRLVCRASQA